MFVLFEFDLARLAPRSRALPGGAEARPKQGLPRSRKVLALFWLGSSKVSGPKLARDLKSQKTKGEGESRKNVLFRRVVELKHFVAVVTTGVSREMSMIFRRALVQQQFHNHNMV